MINSPPFSIVHQHARRQFLYGPKEKLAALVAIQNEAAVPVVRFGWQYRPKKVQSFFRRLTVDHGDISAVL
jgi:hypothetical protein